jgi:molybdenum cofactor biosynthesis enzyme MoaA
MLFGPAYRVDYTDIIIDITYHCNLRCFNCSRSCRQAPTNDPVDQMTSEQIQKFVDESIEKNLRWKRLLIAGGEPLLHPKVFDILEILLEYKKEYSPSTRIELYTAGHGERVIEDLSKVQKGIEIINSSKSAYPACSATSR